MNGSITNGKISYKFHIYNRVNIMIGLSGEGKTLLNSVIAEAKYNVGNIYISESTITNIFFYTSDNESSDLSNVFRDKTNSIIFIDECAANLVIVDKKYVEILKMAVNNNNYLIFIDRAGIEFFIPVNSILILENNSILPIYNKKPLQLSNYTLNVVTEDSGSGLECIMKCFSKVCYSSFGNGNIISLVEAQQKFNLNNELMVYIVDGSVFGTLIREIPTNVLNNENIRFIFIPSLEYLLIKSIKILNHTKPTMLDYDYIVSGLDSKYNHKEIDLSYKEIKTPERYYTHLLKTLLKKHGIEYSKKTLDNIIDLIDFRVLKEELLKWADTYWGCIDLHKEKDKGEHSSDTFESFRDSFSS